MLISRVAPPESSQYIRARRIAESLGPELDTLKPIQWFAIWSVVVAGMVFRAGQADRFVYWEWSGWMDGSIRIIITTLIFYFGLSRTGLWQAGRRRLKLNSIILHVGWVCILFLIGAIGVDFSLSVTVGMIPYIAGFLGGLLVFQFPLELDPEKGRWNVTIWDGKSLLLGLSSVLFGLSTYIGYQLDDPLSSTVAMIVLPFPAVALIWPDHVRHFQRAQFYPLFIFSMFICVRAPWFLVPLAIVFFGLRTMNYLRYGIVYPSFGVDHENVRENV
ncbi:MAG: hypothetical protein VX600_05375 [Candidatus Neomarinimicrobiota bacterium]|nr:hypothetical protein [Candidatus Neomarinimicrobiota bacterium]